MTAPVVQDPKTKAKQEAEAAELQDRIINLQDQERQVQREMAEPREEQERELRQAERESTDRLRQQRTDALDTLSRQARDGARQVEQATRALAQGTARRRSMGSGPPPAMSP
jgi:molecular chaperone GrpE (heat shock protein)